MDIKRRQLTIIVLGYHPFSSRSVGRIDGPINYSRSIIMKRKSSDAEAPTATKTNGNVPVKKTGPELPAKHSGTTVRDFLEEMDKAFNNWSIGRAWLSPLFGRDALMKRFDEFGKDMYLPDIEVLEKDGAMVVRVDLPGIKKEDVSIEVNDNSLVVKGERRKEMKEEREGYYRSERSYGSFYRSIPFRDGIEANDAKATFNDGVLEITLKTRKNVRQIEIK
jgi:HSP20 family protein